MAKHILLIEDDDILAENLNEFLTLKNFKVTKVSDGLKAVELITAHKDFDLILCDMLLPGLTGAEIFELTKVILLGDNIPFIYLSAKSDKSDIRAGMDLGADDYLIKPFSMVELLNTINSRLNKRAISKNRLIEDLKIKLDEFPKILSHEFNTPMNGILGLSTLMHDNYDTFSENDFKTSLKSIIISCKRLQKTQEKFFHFFELLNKPQEMHSPKIFLRDIILSVDLFIIKFKELNDEENRINYSFDNSFINQSFKLQVNSHHLLDILKELLENSLVHSIKKSKIEVKTLINNETKVFEIAVSNQTDSGNFENFDNFKNFLSEKRSLSGRQGFGLGLLFIQKMCDLNGIDFYFYSSESTITFYVKLKLE
jgi:DNA-binding response OmpR family regulator